MDLLLNCTRDADCPVAEVCFKDVSWAPGNTSFCECNTWYGFTDAAPGCTGRGPTFYYLVTMVIVEVAVAGMVLLLAAFDLARVLRLFGLKKRPNSTLITSFSLPLALASFVAWRLFVLLSAMDPAGAEVFFNHGRQEFGTVDAKFGKFEIVQRPFVFLCYLFTVVCAGSLSLVWISLSQRVESMREFNALSAWRNWIVLFFVCFVICMGIVAIFGAFEFTSLVLTPFLIILIFSFGYGRGRMVALLRSAIRFGESQERHSSSRRTRGNSKGDLGPSREAQTKWSRERTAMVAIRSVSTHAMASLLGILVSSFVHYWLNATHPEGWREYSPPGKLAVVTVINDVEALFVVYLLAAIGQYMHRNTENLVRSARKMPDLSTLLNSSNNHSPVPPVPGSPSTAVSFSQLFPQSSAQARASETDDSV